MVKEFLKKSGGQLSKRRTNKIQKNSNYYQANAQDVHKKLKAVSGNRLIRNARWQSPESIAFKVQGRNERSGSSQPANGHGNQRAIILGKKRKLQLQVSTKLRLFAGDVAVVPKIQKKVDSSYVSYYGAIGTSGNEASIHMPKLVLNLTMHFP